MKKLFQKSFALQTAAMCLVVVLLFIAGGCKKFGKPQDVFFYSDIESSAAPMSLFLDGEFKGELPNLHVHMSVDNDTILNQALHLSLKPGKYKLVGKDKSGTTRCDGWIKFSPNSTSSSSTRGGQGMAGSDNTTVVELLFHP